MTTEVLGTYDARVLEYLGCLDTVPGWLYLLDAWAFCEISAVQVRGGARGDSLEIGGYRAKTAILLGLLTSPEERLIVCDLFNEGSTSPENTVENARYYTGFTRAAFEEQYLKWHPSLPDLRVMSSVQLDENEFRKRIRLLHVDGSHNYDIVCHDIAFSRQVLAPGGVVVFDDWSQSHSPGAAAALWEEIGRGDLRPLWLTDTKLYATWEPGPSTPGDEALQTFAGDERCELQWHRIMGHDLPRVLWRSPITETKTARPLTSTAQRLVRRLKRR